MGLTQLHKIKEKERFFNISFDNLHRKYTSSMGEVLISIGFRFTWKNRNAKITGAVYNEEKARYEYICQYDD